ncbi:MAG: SH3 domain-containing protein [Chloroflexota bacterium]|nr:SH3 domain-containing protein [Chloroflexota bacterium]
MNRILPARLGLAAAAVALSLAFVPAASAPPSVLAQSQDLSVDPQAASLTVADLRPGFTLDPSKTELREPVPGITVYEADFARPQTPENFKEGPIEIKSLVARTANAQQAAEQFANSRQALVTASPAWTETKVAKLGDDATGLTMNGTSSAGDAVAHLYLFRRGAMVVGITVAGLVKPTQMAEAEALAATVLGKIDPSYKNQRGQAVPRPLNPRPSASTSASTGTSSGTTGSSGGATATGAASSGTQMQVAKTDNQGVRLRAQPSRTASVVAVLPEGTVVEIVGEDRQGDGLTWKNVRAPGDRRGWVSAEYLAAAPSNASGASAPGAANAAAAATSAASSSSFGSGSSGASATSSPAGSTSSSAASADVLSVDVSLAKTELRDGEQTLTIKVTQQGRPVAGAIPTIRTTRDEQPSASATSADGTATVTWTPAGEAGFVGVGVSVTAPNGATGVGSTYFNLLISR